MALTRRASVVIGLGSAQTLAWGSTYYLPAILAAPMARDLGVSSGLVFGAFSGTTMVAGTPASRAAHARPCAQSPALAVMTPSSTG